MTGEQTQLSTETRNGSEVIPPHDGPPCPFYGFVGRGSFFMESTGNACALTGEHSPCRMEVAGDEPNWDKCPVYNKQGNVPQLKQIMESVTTAPKIFWPSGASSWDGIKFGVWFHRVMGRDFP